MHPNYVQKRTPANCQSEGPLNGGVSQSGFVLFCPFLSELSFFVLFVTFLIFFSGFFRFVRDSSEISRFVLFLFLGLLTAPTREQSRKGLRHNLDLSRKKWETPRFSFSQQRDTEMAPRGDLRAELRTCAKKKTQLNPEKYNRTCRVSML